jgi:RIO kinase 1
LSRPYDNYEDYENLFDPMATDRQARRKRKPKARHTPKKAERAILDDVAETQGLEGGFQTTYVPGLFEEGWLLQSLEGFYNQSLITDVLARVKGGKEASVYRCAANPSLGLELVAAKVYRPQMFRNLRNDKMYREGRAILNENGNAVKKTDHRVMRAINKKSDFGEAVAHTSWLMYEYKTLQTLHAAGAAVPKPISTGGNAILMEYIGDEHLAAPALSDVELARDEAEPLFREVIRNIELMLQHGMIHGDLSAYNLLYWEGAVVLIDFPQVTDSRGNGQAYTILQRDITRVCEYFSRQGVRCNPSGIMERLWRRYAAKDARVLAADMSRLTESDEDEE